MGTFVFDPASADSDQTVIETFRAISRTISRSDERAGSSIPSNGAGSLSDERGGSSNPSNRGGSTTAPSECSDDEESGELGDAFANDASAPHMVPAATTLVKPISRRPSASNLPSLADVGAAPQVRGRGRGRGRGRVSAAPQAPYP